MTVQTHDTQGKCPVAFGLDLFGDRWSLLIIRDIVFKGKSHYSDFARSPEKISTNILANRLARLEGEGILSRRPDPTNQTRRIYRLTEKGEALIPVLLEIVRWSAAHDPGNEGRSPIIDGAPVDLLDRLRDDREALLADLVAAMRGTETP
jgi:DNA-binding HxlR family transcriptional regulator